MTVHCVLGAADYRAFRRHVLFRYQRLHWFFAGMLALVLCVSWFGARPEDSTADKINGLIGTTVMFTAITAVLFLIRRLIGSRSRPTLGEHTFDISPTLLREINPHECIETHVDGIRSVDETNDYFFIISNAGHGHVIPKRALRAADDLRLLQGAVRGRKA